MREYGDDMDNKTFSERVKRLMDSAKVSRAEMAAATGISPATMRKVICGTQCRNISIIERIADFFGVSVDYLMGRTDELEKSQFGRYFAKNFWRVYRTKPSDLTFPRRYHATYPFNLVAAIFGECDLMDFIEKDKYTFTEDAEEAVKEAVGTLTEREQKVIQMRYECLMTLEEIAKEFNLTRNRIRQIEARALRKLRHPSRSRAILLGKDGLERREEAKAVNESIEELERQREKLLAEVNQLKADIYDREHETSPAISDGIETLELSVRSYNCLKRAGIRTIADLDLRMRDNDWFRIRNLGRKSADEIVTRMEEHTKKDYSWARKW